MTPAEDVRAAVVAERGAETLSNFDTQRLRDIPTWMVRDMAPGWHAPGTAAIHGAEAIERLEKALSYAVQALRTVGDDYPGSSCQKWCHDMAEGALILAKGRPA